jgi:hypothetical protein
MRSHLARRSVRAFAALAVLSATLGLGAQWAGAVHDDGVFELDGNLADGVPAGDDWVTLQADTGSDGAFTGVLNDRVSDTTYFNGGGSKDIYDISSWGSNGNSAPPKDEITNAYAASYTVGTHHVIYFGVDRGATNGDSQMGFWFFQNSVGVDGTGFSGSHVARDTANGVNGDLLVLSDFTKGGKVGSVKVLEWVGDGSGSDGNLDLILSQNVADGQPSPQCGAVPQPTPDDSVCAIENSGSVPVPTGWSYNGTSFPKSAIIEGGIDVTELFPDSNSCFASFQAETRSSQEPNATLKDFRGGSFEACFPTTAVTAGSASPAVIHNGQSSTARFTETNDGNVSLTEPANGYFECSSDAGTASVAPVLSGAYNVGDTNTDGVLDGDEAWQFDCTVTGLTAASGTITITGTGHGIDPNTNDDLTHCADPDNPPTGVECDQDEQATATFSVINPSTTMSSSVSAVVTYTFTETNDGDAPLTRTAALNYVRSSDCTISETLTPSTTFNIGDANQDGVLDVGETWTFTCQRTFTTTGSNATVAIGHGTDSATSGKDITYCSDPSTPPTGARCDQDERQSITVNITKP